MASRLHRIASRFQGTKIGIFCRGRAKFSRPALLRLRQTNFPRLLANGKLTSQSSNYFDRIGSFLGAGILRGPGDRVLREACLFKLAASNIAARSGNELDRRRLFWSGVVLMVCGSDPPSSCVIPLRIPNCFLNHFLVKGLIGGLRFPSLSMSFMDWTSALWLACVPESLLFMSSCRKSNWAGLFFFDDILKNKTIHNNFERNDFTVYKILWIDQTKKAKKITNNAPKLSVRAWTNQNRGFRVV